MKKLNYLFVAIMFFVFTACGGSETATKEATQSLQESTEIADVSTCNEECQKACCLGCKATDGDAKCIVLEDGSMPCCIVKNGANQGEAHDHNHDNHNHE